MRKPNLLLTVIGLLMISFVLFLFSHAEAQNEDITPSAEIETITSADLGISNPGTLPTSRLYFLKEWGRGIRRAFTFNPIAKAELELKITNEKAAETAKIHELSPNDDTAMAKALANYKNNQERLKTRLNSLKETSQNQNVDKLLEELAERTVKHEKLFTEIGKKLESHKEIQNTVEEVRTELVERVKAAAGKDEPEKFVKRFEKNLEDTKGLERLRTVEFVDRLQGKLPDQTEEPFMKLRDNFSQKLGIELKEILEKNNSEDVKKMIKKIPGDYDRLLMILDEVRDRDTNQLPKTFGKITEELNTETTIGSDIKARAEMQTKKAEELIKLLENKLSRLMASGILPPSDKKTTNDSGNSAERTVCDDRETPACPVNKTLECRYGKWVCIGPATAAGFAINEPGVPNDKKKQVEHALEDAKYQLSKAREDFEKEQYGSSFGHARSAESIARNGLRMIEIGMIKPAGKEFMNTNEVTPGKPDETSGAITKPGTVGMERPAFESKCEMLKRNLYDLEIMFKNQKISEDDFKLKAERLRKEISICTTQTTPYKQPVEIKPIPIKPAYPAPSISCEQIKKYLSEVLEMYKTGRINEADYTLKYENLQKQLAGCVSQITPTPVTVDPVKIYPEPITTTPPSTGGIVCTQDYSPVCGNNGKTFSNTCYAKISGIGIAYAGECKTASTVCSNDYRPVCGSNGKTYSNECLAKYAGVYVKYAGVCQSETTSSSVLETGTTEPTPPTIQPEISELKIEADDFGFYPAEIYVTKGSKIKLTIVAKTSNVYYGGLQFASSKFKTGAIKPGGSTIIEFLADESFEIQSYWPLTNAYKASAKVIIQLTTGQQY